MRALDWTGELRAEVIEHAERRLRQTSRHILDAVSGFCRDAGVRANDVTGPRWDGLGTDMFRALAAGLRGLLATTPCVLPETSGPIYLFYGWAASGIDRVGTRRADPTTDLARDEFARVLKTLLAATEEHMRIGYEAAVAEIDGALEAVLRSRTTARADAVSHEQIQLALCDAIGLADPDLIEVGYLVAALWRAFESDLARCDSSPTDEHHR